MSVSHYYVPEQSKWPLVASTGLFLTLFGMATLFNQLKAGVSPYGQWFLIAGALTLIYMMFGWFNDVIRESRAGLYSAQLDRSFVYGMSWFIFSEVMFFGAFFGTLLYIRMFAVPWLGGEGHASMTKELLWPDFSAHWPLMTNPDPKRFAGPGEIISHLGLPLWNTIILLTSSVTITFAHHALEKNKRGALKLWMFATVALGITFLFLQAEEYHEAYSHLGLTLASGIYGSTFFMMTGFHGLHVTIGTLMLIIMLLRILKGHFEPAPEKHFAFRATAWYWHFVDVVWVMLYFFVYWL